MTILRLWLLATLIIAAGLALWAFAPVMIFVLLITVGLGGLSALMIALARLLQSRAGRDHRTQETEDH
jgi:hypothetical protein